MGDQATGLPSGYDVRETAEDGAPAGATATAPRTFTEGEAYALVADNVQRETASKTAEIEQLKSEKAELQTKVELKDTELATEKAAREKAEGDLQAIKDAEVAREAAAARTDERVSKVKEVAQHLADDFYTPERAARWAAMEDEAFDAYVKELADLSAGLPKADATKDDTKGGAPRETAMAGQRVTGGGDSDKPKGLAGLTGFFPTAKGGN